MDLRTEHCVIPARACYHGILHNNTTIRALCWLNFLTTVLWVEDGSLEEHLNLIQWTKFEHIYPFCDTLSTTLVLKSILFPWTCIAWWPGCQSLSGYTAKICETNICRYDVYLFHRQTGHSLLKSINEVPYRYWTAQDEDPIHSLRLMQVEGKPQIMFRPKQNMVPVNAI